MAKPPNILLIVTDQQRPDLIGALGRLPVKTPALDRLCRQGTAFIRAYTACPLCTPSRASILSGQYPSRHGAWSIGVNTPADVLALPTLLSQGAGYRTGLIGKSHFQSNLTPDSFEALPRSRDWEFFRHWSGPYYGFDHARLHVGHGHEPHAYCLHYGLFLHDAGIPPNPPYFAVTNSGENYREIGKWSLPEKYHTSTWVADETIHYLRDHVKSSSDRPFFLSVNFPDPHLPFLVPEPWDQLHDDVVLPPPARHMDELTTNNTTLYRATLEQRTQQLSWHEHAAMPCQESTGLGRETAMTSLEDKKWRIYMGMQSLLDKHLGRVLDTLSETGLTENTLVIYTSDHGDYMGDHWLWSKGGSHYDSAVRVPFIVRWPGQIMANTQSHALQSLVDLAPSLLRAAGLEVPATMQGIDQLGAWQDPSTALRAGTLIEHRVERGLTVQSWITATHRLSLHSIIAENRDELELYDLSSDPYELNNLANQESSQRLIAQLSAQLLRYKQAISGPWLKRGAFA